MHWTDPDASTWEGNEATTTNSSDSKHTLDVGGVPIVSHLSPVSCSTPIVTYYIQSVYSQWQIIDRRSK